MGLSDNCIDEVCFVSQTLEEQITACSVTVRFDIELRKIRLK